VGIVFDVWFAAFLYRYWSVADFKGLLVAGIAMVLNADEYGIAE
jgi:hypothetical protein